MGGRPRDLSKAYEEDVTVRHLYQRRNCTTLIQTQAYIFFKHKEKHMRTRRKYGLMKFIFDAALVVVTGGFWLIWIFVREMRGR